MTDRAKAVTYGVVITCVVSLALLIAESPNGATLAIAIGLGIAGAAGAYAWMVRQ